MNSAKFGIDSQIKEEATVNIRCIDESAVVPTRCSAGAAGYDLYAHMDCDALAIQPFETVRIGTGICIEIPDDCFGAVCARSGLATKKGLAPINAPGVVDCDYRGEVIVALHNYSSDTQTIENGERIAQMIIMPFVSADFNVVESLGETERGGGGFGSTGNK